MSGSRTFPLLYGSLRPLLVGLGMGPGGKDHEAVRVEALPQLPQIGLDAPDLGREVVRHQEMAHRLTARTGANTAPCSHGPASDRPGRSAGGPVHGGAGVAELGDEAGRTFYVDSRGREKEVRYYLMTSDGEPFAQNEVDEVRWVPLAEAADVLSYSHDRELVGGLA